MFNIFINRMGLNRKLEESIINSNDLRIRYMDLNLSVKRQSIDDVEKLHYFLNEIFNLGVQTGEIAGFEKAYEEISNNEGRI